MAGQASARKDDAKALENLEPLFDLDFGDLDKVFEKKECFKNGMITGADIDHSNEIPYLEGLLDEPLSPLAPLSDIDTPTILLGKKRGFSQLELPDFYDMSETLSPRFFNNPLFKHSTQEDRKLQDGLNLKPPQTSFFGLPNNYSVIEFIGEGGFASVFRVQDEETGEEFAAKAFKCLETSIMEKEYLDMLKGVPNMPAMIDYFVSNKKGVIIMELVPGKDIFELVHGAREKATPLPESDVKHIIKDVLIALHAIHSRNLVHSDVKIENIIYDVNTKRAQLIDATLVREKKIKGFAEYLGTPGCLSPECYRRTIYRTPKKDIWALGCAMYNMATGESLFQCLSCYLEAEKALRDRQPDFFNIACNYMSHEGFNFLSLMLTENWTQRPTAEELLKHVWLVEC